MTRYPVPRNTVRIEHKVKNSRFIATVGRTSSVAEAKEFIAAMRREMPDANHHVYAFKIGYGSSLTEGMSDDGEPSGTSGPPVMAVLHGALVGDITLVVTRYFGGTKLGTGGLVAAYSQSAKLVLAEMRTEDKVDRIGLALTIPYSALTSVEKSLAQHEAINIEKEFGAEITVSFEIPDENEKPLSERLTDILKKKVIWQPVAVEESRRAK
jgi:uncharacterized YigZ family protein